MQTRKILRARRTFGVPAGPLLWPLILAGCAAADGAKEYREQQLQAELHSQKVRLAEQQAAMEDISRKMAAVNRQLDAGPVPAPSAPPATPGVAAPSPSLATGLIGEPSRGGSAVAVSSSTGAAEGSVAAGAPAPAPPSSGAPAPAAPPAAEPKVVAGDDHFREKVSETLKELLKDPAFAKEFKGSGGAKVGYKKDIDYQGSGFFIEDGDFRLNIEGRLQTRYTYYNMLDKTRKNGATDTSDTNKDVRSDFSIPRLRLNFNGFAFSKDITYMLEIDASSNNRAGGDGGAGGIGDIADMNLAFVNWNVLGSNKEVGDFFSDSLHVRVGQFQMPFGRSGVIQTWARQAELDTHLVDRMMADQFFRADRNIGAELHGSLGGFRDGLPSDRPGTKGFFEYDLAVSNGFQSKGQRYGLDSGATGTAGRGLDKYPALIARGNFDILKGRYEGEDGKDYYWFGRNVSDMEHHLTPAWQAGGSFGWQRIRDQNSPGDNSSLGDFYRPPQEFERLATFDKNGKFTGFTNGNLKPVDKPGSDMFRIGADTAFKWQGFAIQSEFYAQFLNGLYNQDGLAKNQSQENIGGYITAGYFVIPKKWELVAGYSGIWAPDRPLASALPSIHDIQSSDPTKSAAAIKAMQAAHAAGTDGSQNGMSHQISFGTNYFPFSNQKLRLSADVSYLINQPFSAPTQGYVESGGENAWQFRAQVTIGF